MNGLRAKQADSLLGRRFGIGWWNLSGLSAAASAGASELQKRGMNRVIYDSTKYGVTIVIARGDRAKELRQWFEGGGGSNATNPRT